MRWLVVALVLGCAACGSASTPDHPTPLTSSETSSAPSSAPSSAIGSPNGVQTVPTGQGPVGLAVDPEGDVWVADATSSDVSRIHAGRRDITVTGVDTPLRLAAYGGAIWATAFGTGELVRISEAGAIAGRVAVGDGAEGVAAGFGSVWVVAQDAGRLVRVDPNHLSVIGQIDIGDGARLVTTGLGSVWVSQFRDGTVLRVDPRTKKVTTSGQLCQGPQGLAVTDGALWVTCTGDDVLLRLDPRTLKPTRRVAMPEAPDGLAVGTGHTLYVVAQAGPTLVNVDTASAAVRSTRALGTQPQLFDQANLDVAVSGSAVWLSSFTENNLRRVDPAAA